MQNAAEDYASFTYTAAIMQIVDKRQKNPLLCIIANTEEEGVTRDT